MIRTRSITLLALVALLASLLSAAAQADSTTVQLAVGERLDVACAAEQIVIVPRAANGVRASCPADPVTPTPVPPTATPSPTVAPSSTPSPTSTPVPSATVPPTPTPLPSPTATATAIPTATSLPTTPLPTATGLPTATAPPEANRPSANLAYFWRPGADGPANVQDIARRAKLIALQKEDLPFLKALRTAGYTGPVVQYFLTLEVQNPAGVAYAPWGNNWFYRAGDWTAATDDMFLRKADGSRLSGPGNGMYYLDPTSPKARAFVVARVKEAQASGFDGIILDNLRLRWNMLRSRAGGTFYSGTRQAYTSEADFLKAEIEFLALIRQANGMRPLWANLIDDNFSGTSWDAFLPYLDGGMNESWATGWPLHGYPATATQQLGMLKQAETVLKQGKGLLAVGQGTQSDLVAQQFFTASWLLIADGSDRATLRFTQADKGYGQWWRYDTYSIDCGQPNGPRYTIGTLQQRTWTRCLVTVDPAKRTGTIQVVTP